MGKRYGKCQMISIKSRGNVGNSYCREVNLHVLNLNRLTQLLGLENCHFLHLSALSACDNTILKRLNKNC